MVIAGVLASPTLLMKSSPQAPETPSTVMPRAARLVVNAVKREGGVERVSCGEKGWRSGWREENVRRRLGREAWVRTRGL